MSKQRKSGERGIGFYTAIREASGKQQREYASILLHSAASESEPGNEHSFVNKEQTDDIFFDCEDENNLEGMECVDEEEDEVFDDDVENDDDDDEGDGREDDYHDGDGEEDEEFSMFF